MLTHNEIFISLERTLGRPVVREDWALTNLSPGLSPSRVYAVCDTRDANAPRYILKVPDWSETAGLASRDPMVATRETRFWQSPAAERVRDAVQLPTIARIDSSCGKTLLWMQDISSAFRSQWTTSELEAAAVGAAKLMRVYQRHASELESMDWMARDGFAMYDVHVPAALHNLERARNAADGACGVEHRSLDCLRACLAANDWACDELRALPRTLVHGDYHARNVSFAASSEPIVLDWANVGIGPLGSDIATLLSLHGLFGGGALERNQELESWITRMYCDALDLNEVDRRQVEYSIWLRALTWGLHLRLGAALTALLDGRISDPASRAAVREDIRAGCERVLDGLLRFESPIAPLK